MTGLTNAGDFPSTGGYPYGGEDAYVPKLDLDLSGAASLVYSTFIGGGQQDPDHSIAVEPTTGEVYDAGKTMSAETPAPMSTAM